MKKRREEKNNFPVPSENGEVVAHQASFSLGRLWIYALDCPMLRASVEAGVAVSVVACTGKG